MTIIASEAIEYLANSGEAYPNVVRLNIPSDHREDGAAWIFVPSKGPNGTIYIGPPGSYSDGGSIELASTIKTLADVPKGVKLISGVMYDDGYVDYFQTSDEDLQDNITGALRDYHDAYYSGNGALSGSEDEDQANGPYHNYPIDYDDTAYDPEDDNDGDSDPIYDPDSGEIIGYLPKEDRGINKPDLGTLTGDENYSWLADRDWSGKNDNYRTMKLTQGHNMGPIEDWSPEDHLAWRDRADVDRKNGNVYGAAREQLSHFRWSFGDDSLVSGAPHEGLWLWPTENAYPDHFSQTGTNGLGRCAQGRVYPTIDGKWEILTWPGRPRQVKDPQIKAAIKAKAQAAVKQYLVDKIGVDPKDIFYTEDEYMDAVSNHNSPSYPGYSYKKYKSPAKNDRFNWDSGGNGFYTSPPLFDENGDASFRSDIHGEPLKIQYKNFIPDRYKVTLPPGLPPGHYDSARQGWIPNEPGIFDAVSGKYYPDDPNPDDKGSFFDTNPSPGILHKVIDKIRGQQQQTQPTDQWQEALTPEEKWEETIRKFDAERQRKDQQIADISQKYGPPTVPSGSDVSQVPDGTSKMAADDGDTYMLHKDNGQVTIVDQGAYELAVSEYGHEHWHLAFVSPKEQVTSITKGATNIHDEMPDTPESYLDQIRTQDQPTMSTGTWEKDVTMFNEAFCWLGFGYGEDAGNADPSEAEVITGKAHWSIVKSIIGKKLDTVSDFLDSAKDGTIKVPMVWGWVTTHKGLPGIYVTFMSHLMDNMRQDSEYIPIVLGALAQHYNRPIEDWNVEESETPIMESFPVSGGGKPPEPLATAPTPTGAGQQSIDLSGFKTLAEDTVGYSTITTYLINGHTFETQVEGGELDGHVFPSYTEDEAYRMHDTLVRDEQNLQHQSSLAIMDDTSWKGIDLAFDLNPEWQFVYGYSEKFLPAATNNLVVAYSVPQIVNTFKTAGVQHYKQIVAGRIGKVFGQTWVYDSLAPISDEEALKIEAALQEKFGVDLLPFDKLEASVASGEIPSFLLPDHGCFGYLNGNLIIGARHHQEVMYRLLEKGWTWDDLMNAEQAWGWFSKGYNEHLSMWFSSDAGIIEPKMEAEVMAKFSSMFGMTVKKTGGYGGKDKTNYGGNFKDKYGDPVKEDPAKMTGYKAKLANSIISPLPAPPEKVEEVEKESVVTKAFKAIFPNPPPKKTAVSTRPSVQYHGLHDPVVLRHVWQNHDWFESQVPRSPDAPDPGDNNDVTTMSEDVGPETVAA